MRSFVLSGMFLLSMSGCASEDPSEGGFFGGLVGLGTGAYEKRATEKTASWRSDERRYQAELETGDQLDGSVRSQHDQIADLKRQAIVLEDDIFALSDEIDALRSQETVTSDELAAAEGRVALLIDDIDSLQAGQDTLQQAPTVSVQSIQSDVVSGTKGELGDAELIALRSQIEEVDRVLADLRSSQQR